MLKMITKMIKYPRLTVDYPKKPFDTSLVLGKPVIDPSKCTFCGECVRRCPTNCIIMDKTQATINIEYDKCIYCVLCEDVCPEGAAIMTNQIEFDVLANELKAKSRKIFGRSLQIREVDSGSCNGCDYEINALNNPFNDIERLGISFVASPRHADMLLVTGTATRNMELALRKTYDATPSPKLVVAVGACACSGGIFRDSYATNNGISKIVPVDVLIPGCPPRPQAIIYGILKALDRIETTSR